MTTQFIASNVNLGSKSMGLALPYRQNLTLLHLPNTTYLSGTSMPNLAVGGTASTVTGSPTFDAQGMTPNVQGDGLLSSVIDVVGDVTVFALAASLDTLANGAANSAFFLSSFAADSSGTPSGPKGFQFGPAAGSGNTATISSVARTSNVVTIVLTAAPATAFVTGQLVSVSGITVDSTMNTGNVPTALTVISTTSFSYASVGANLATTSSGGTVWNGVGKMSAVNTVNVSATNTKITENISETTINTPHFYAATVNTSTGVNTLYDFTTGSTPVVSTSANPRLVAPNNQTWAVGTGLIGAYFGKCKIYAAGVHTGLAVSQANLNLNYTALKNLLGVG